MSLYWIDSHSHLSDEGFRKDPTGYLARAKENNVQRILAISCSKEDWKWNTELSEKEEGIDVAVGFYPGDVRDYDDSDYEELKEMIKHPSIIAIGEIGLDYYWDKSFIDLQKSWFIRQIELANEVELPICIHARDALEDIYSILKEHPVKKGALMHCYSGSKEMATQLMTLDTKVLFAFGGTLTYKNNRRGVETVEMLPMDRILTETDSPYLTPQLYRGQRNESKNVRYVGEYIAELKGLSIEEVQESIMKNYSDFFGVKL